MISHDPRYQTAKASVYYWQKQLRLGKDRETCNERLEWWGDILAAFRLDRHRHGRPLGALGKSNPRYIAPAKMPKVKKEVIRLKREVWVPPPLSWV